MGWQWQQLNNMQVIYNSRQIDNHASTSALYRDALPATQQVVLKHRRQMLSTTITTTTTTTTTTTILQPFFRHYPGESVPEG